MDDNFKSTQYNLISGVAPPWLTIQIILTLYLPFLVITAAQLLFVESAGNCRGKRDNHFKSTQKKPLCFCVAPPWLTLKFNN